MSKTAQYFLDRLEKPRQTTDYKVGDILYEKDCLSPDEILDVLFIIEAEHGNPLSEDPEEYTSYYKFYSFNENNVWEYEPLDSGSIIYYERYN